MTSSPSESQLLAWLLRVAPFALPDLRLFRRQIMLARTEDRTVRAGLKGQADLYGIARNGLHLELELKAAGGRLSPAQRAWQAWCLSWGVPHLVLQAWGEESVEQTVGRWVGEIREALRGL